MKKGMCTLEYRVPDALLGNHLFGPDVDMWSSGCVAAELFLGEHSFTATHVDTAKRQVLEAQARLLGPHQTQCGELVAILAFLEKIQQLHTAVSAPGVWKVAV